MKEDELDKSTMERLQRHIVPKAGTPPELRVEYRKLFEFHNQQLFTCKITTKSFIFYSLQVETMNVRPI